MTQSDLRAIQRERETAAANDGTAAFWKRLAKTPQHSPLAKSLIRTSWAQLDDHIQFKQGSFLKAGQNLTRSRIFLLAINSDSLAVITIRCLIQKLDRDFDEFVIEKTESTSPIKKTTLKKSRLDEETDKHEGAIPEVDREAETKYTALARDLGRRCAEHWGFMTKAAKMKGISRALSKFKSRSSFLRAQKDLAKSLRKDWAIDDDDLGLGKLLLDAAEDADLVDVRVENLTKPPWNAPNLVLPSDAFSKALKEWGDKHRNLIDQPFYLPMLVPPNPWGPKLNDGGYLSNAEAKFIHLVKHRNSRNIRKALKHGDLTVTLTAVNALQNTPWRVNPRIYGLMCQVRELIKSKKLDRAKWTKRIFRKLKVCSTYADAREIYFPYFVDFRGRVYCLPSDVNPQTDDLGRSLLEFAGSKPLGDRGVYWLAVHVANSFGQDKISYSARVSWVKSNQDMILACASDPLSERTWTTAEDPWRFLRACFEWQDHLPDGPTFPSHLPILVDGTCNGLQHISALRLSAEGAKHTNLLPATCPQDIYKKVAEDLTVALEADQSAGSELAREWLDKVGVNRKMDRKICKKAVMTTPYGVTPKGIQLQLRKADFTEVLEMHGCSPYQSLGIKYKPRLIDILVTHTDPVSQIVWNRFSLSGQQLLASPDTPTSLKNKCLVTELNAISEGASLFDEACFAKGKLTEETKFLCELALSPFELARLNRLLLEDSYPRHLPKKSRRWECCEYLAAKLLNCIGDIVDPGGEMKNWLQSIAKALAEFNIGLTWISPTGFPVVQETWKSISKCVYAGKHKTSIYKPTLLNNQPVLDVDSQQRGVVANFIHSLDAAHLMLTVRRLHMEDLGNPIHLQVIHDGYGTHACDVDKLHKVLREEFVGMYKTSMFNVSVLERFRSIQKQAAASRRVDFCVPPAQGEFDIRVVLKSPYFFC